MKTRRAIDRVSDLVEFLKEQDQSIPVRVETRLGDVLVDEAVCETRYVLLRLALPKEPK